MTSFASNENNAERGVVERRGIDLENEQPSPFSPMTDASTLRDADAVSMSDSDGSSTLYPVDHMKLKHQVDHYRDGWPMLAAKQNAKYNGASFRRFGRGSNRVINHLQGRMVNLLGQLDELDATSDTHLKSWSAGQRRKAGEEYRPDPYDIIMDELREALDQHCRFVHHDKEMKTLDGPVLDEVLGVYEELKKRATLDEEALSFMDAPDDFVSTGPQEDHTAHFRSLVYSPWGSWIRRFLSPDGQGRWDVKFKTLVRLDGIAILLFLTFIMMGPVGILYLAPLTRAESFLVVLLFVATFGAAMVLPKDPRTKFRDILVVVFAYAAVLSSFLAQMG